MRFDSGRTRLYFCPQCGTLVGCVRKKRCNPGRKCKLERCIDFVKCRLRAIMKIIIWLRKKSSVALRATEDFIKNIAFTLLTVTVVAVKRRKE
jgi:hypothetical protein